MAGIVVGLGGTARNTERGSSLKQFIRSGETTAEIKINLRNRGKEAYRPEVFGECIIVERAIKRDGTGSYKVKNSKGKTNCVIYTKIHCLNSFFFVCFVLFCFSKNRPPYQVEKKRRWVCQRLVCLIEPMIFRFHRKPKWN